MAIALRYALRSDIGLVRANNQDSGFAAPNLLVVADGMGGHAGGDVASSIAIAALAPLSDDSFGSDEALKVLERTIDEARDQLIQRSADDPELVGMGTTVTAILRAGNKLAMAHMGDSRAYLLRDGQLTQVTTDHTFVQHLVDTGKITAEEAEVHPQRSVVMRVLGDFGLDLTPDLSMREARAGDRWLLCSDGLCGFVSHNTMQQTVQEIEDPEACVERLVQLALRAGGPDNITCIVADVLQTDDLTPGVEPSTGIQIAGSAALDRDIPSIATDGPAARAAALVTPTAGEPSPTQHGEDPRDDEDDVGSPPRKRRRGLGALVTVLFIGLVGAGGWFGYEWTQAQYYLGIADGTVTIFRGIPQTVGPLTLSTEVERTKVKVETLPDYVVDRLEQSMPQPSLTAAQTQALKLAVPEVEVELPESTPTPSPASSSSPSSALSPSPTPTPTAGSDPSGVEGA